MAKKPAPQKLDKDGFIFVLAIAALALIFFVFYFISPQFRNTTKEALEPITSSSQLKDLLNEVDGQNPDNFKNDLNSNSTDAQNF